MKLADAEGLDAVSIRRVAAALKTRPMGLYSFIDRKEDLVDLMIDEVSAEGILEEVPTDWREGLAAVARAIHRTGQAHPWLAGAAGRRPRIGPNAIRLVDQSLHAISHLDADRATKLSILRTIDLYAIGHLHADARHTGAAGADLADPSWHASAQAHLEALAASGDYPHLATFGTQGLLPGNGDDSTFETGLEWLLTGIEARLTQGFERS
ncbi:TetR/AcrR family transcriptional regulator C-terminal domain-containing protein [Streptomyces chartreusis]|uniref:TetR/AcrR family transcriptional regulator C-terminal domain-containing protein n=1 Tax=Streptomyces chartreusis TaxID=1969 RepID=UPI003710FBC0